ncbi:MAG: Isopentenyl phosphate kinase enzyme of modified mevalonate pathway [Candidatus Methanohalarchaeum thermophilum]|uniref:Isopentenyl phosphate kinase n=1 Tax=Methanohalarchaeum thermophilum TaxID=1903181 RepID=A0A1Q6DRY0_METT1|nr:MAG: Isopentenyl phosphate kinase enzyme of modified mevalonate pathway [Candidatus Methanohalarchaeum thermophilum]
MKIIKIGGSLITDKDSYKTPDTHEINRIAREISKGINSDRLILIHGAGSFGHPLVKKFKLNKKSTNKDLFSILKVQDSVRELNRLFKDSLNKEKIPAYTIHPSSITRTENGEIIDLELNTIRQALKEGYIPLLYGDMVLDTKNRASVLSGDRLVSFLAQELKPNKVGMATTTPVLDKNNQKIDLITQTDLENIGESNSTDVTGGMLNKVNELLKTRAKSYIFNAKKRKALEKFIKGKNIGTEVEYDDKGKKT